ncbi:MAG TPA: glucosidase [Silvibacterium sp.]|nr:glucosidase [Silvibacterium sp.]
MPIPVDKPQESLRLEEARVSKTPWRKWGPYLSERQWGTVREDYSKDGNAWDYFSHDQSRSRAYRWGEDGIAGISDDLQRLCFSLALWNGKDPILKERMFGLTNSEGNHGEDVKEYYFYLDSTPTHSYMKYLYKYPQAAYPYDDLVTTNRARTREEMEYELLDTGVFNDDRYFDIFVEYAKAEPEDILIRITAENRGPDDATLHLLPTLWFRNTWTGQEGALRPALFWLEAAGKQFGSGIIRASHAELGDYELIAEDEAEPLFCDNETNRARIYRETREGYAKDGINDYIVAGMTSAINPVRTGTKAALHYNFEVPAKGRRTIQLRLRPATVPGVEAFASFASIFDTRSYEADEFYGALTRHVQSEDQRQVIRQALAGMLWSKQFYYYDLELWLREHDMPGVFNKSSRNDDWSHMMSQDILSMPDKWEYPWFAAWDLAFHTLPLGLVDLDFAKSQIDLILRSPYLHPNGQVPAYEWNFGDVNPPVHAWALLALHRQGEASGEEPDYEFLKVAFRKLLLNFTWWVNRKDASGKNLFQGGFLGLDNIGVFDRSSPLPMGGYLEQADGTAWMCLFSQTMLQLSMLLTENDNSYSEMVLKFLQHFLAIAAALNEVGPGEDGMWDEEDGFFYDVLRLPNGASERLKVRTMVGLLPLCATNVIEDKFGQEHPEILNKARVFLERHQVLRDKIGPISKRGVRNRVLLSVLNEGKLRRILKRMLDEEEFLSDYGIRSISKHYKDHPYVFEQWGARSAVEYVPAESNTGMFGGNSNWRGPIWIPVNALILRALYNLYQYYGDDFLVECPTGSGKMMTLFEVTQEISQRLGSIFTRNEEGKRPVYGSTEKFQNDPHWRDLILFFEYFHGDNGAGLGASHQTGWTGAIASLLHMQAAITAENALATATPALAASAGTSEVNN